MEALTKVINVRFKKNGDFHQRDLDRLMKVGSVVSVDLPSDPRQRPARVTVEVADKSLPATTTPTLPEDRPYGFPH